VKQAATGESRTQYGSTLNRSSARVFSRAMLASASLFALCSGAVQAQEAAANPSVASGQTGSGDEEIIVTAQKREQAIDDVAMSIDALTAHQMQNQGVLRVENLDRAVAGFTYAESRVGTPIYTLRGVGFNDIALGGRPTVSVYNDEAPVPFAIETRSGFFDVNRVEVLKGPQGTLFGHNST
jgi:outer membrane receptor protein involved in Fe transport